jgi:4-amino-4-deoxy-L-arabinose transferase-like glycosyltransferase
VAPRTDHRLPWPLLATMAAVALFELILAWTTAGTFDVTIFRSFADTVRQVGPVDIYGLDSAGLMVYNHPPLVGWWLVLVDWVASLGVPFGFMIRLPSVLAHAASVYLVFDMLRRRTTPRHALVAGFGVALSPLLLIIAGFHGNNDPVVAALLLAAVWLLVDRRRPAWAGFVFSLAVSVKITPLVVLPILLVAAWALGRDPSSTKSDKKVPLLHNAEVKRFVLGGMPVFVVLWGPALVLSTNGYLRHVMAYNGSGFPRVWGPYQVLRWLDAPDVLLNLYARPGTYLVALVCALLPAWLIRYTPQRLPAAVALSLSGFLLLSPGWATQYLAWIAAAVFLMELWPALVFTAGAGTVYLVLYWQWRGDVRPLEPGQIPILFVAWLVLIPVVVLGMRALLPFRAGPDATIAE